MRRAKKITTGNMLVAMSKLVRQVPASSEVLQYAAAIIAATHPESETATDMVKKYVRYGASPRGAQALLLGGRVLALLKGRYNVALDDLRELAPAALRHRILMNFEGQAEGIKRDVLITDLVAKLKT